MLYETALKIVDIIQDIHKGKYRLPAIQREFVWSPNSPAFGTQDGRNLCAADHGGGKLWRRVLPNSQKGKVILKLYRSRIC
jgi:hypothetical protein